MATTSLNTMLPAFGRTIGAFIGSFTTTTAIAANTSVVSTELTDSGFNNDDSLNDTFIKITSANNDDTVRRVTDYTASSGTMLVIISTNMLAQIAKNSKMLKILRVFGHYKS